MQVLLYNGHQLGDHLHLSETHLEHGCTLYATARLRGGGGDGGSTGAESRSCYLEMYLAKKPDKVNPAEQLLANRTRCHLSGERLAPPCVCDELGTLFNKEAIVHALLHKSMPAALSHITSMKSLINLKLERIPHMPGGKAHDVDFHCPITGLELNGRYRFVVHRPSGHVVSERALKEIPAAVEDLLGGSWQPDDMIPLNPTHDELQVLKQRLLKRMQADRDRKKAKKLKNGSGAGADVAAPGDANGTHGDAAHKRSAAGMDGSTGLPPLAKKMKAADLKLPQGATAEVYASLFVSSKPGVKETYMCRSVSGRHHN